MATHRRATAAVLVTLVCALAATGCTTAPVPTASPTSTGFASDDAAFAAAEATYRAYVDATNARRSDPNSRPDPTDFLTSDALNATLNAQRRFDEEGIRLIGNTQVTSVNLVNSTPEYTTIHVCLDNAATKVINREGLDVTPADRVAVGGLEVVILTGTRAQVSQSRTDDNGC